MKITIKAHYIIKRYLKSQLEMRFVTALRRKKFN